MCRRAGREVRAKFKLNRTEFDKTLKAYSRVTKRDIPTILNTKGFYILRRATIEMKKADKSDIARDLGRIIRTGKNAGALRTKKGANAGGAPLAALIINKRLGPGRGLHGAKMEEAIRKMIGARNKAIAFLKSGNLPGIKTLEPLAEKRGAPRQDRSAAQVGKAKGSATPAREAWRTKCTIINAASARKDMKEALHRYGGPGWQKAFDAEAASMKGYMEKKARKNARDLRIKTR